MTKEEIDEGLLRLEEQLIKVCKNDGIKFESNKYYEVQAAMIAGFIACCNEVPVGLGIAIMARRPIINGYK